MYGQWYLSNLCNFFSNQRCFCVHVCKLHLKSSHNDHSLNLSMNRGYTTSILQLTAKKIYTNVVFYTGNKNHNHSLSLSYIECGNHRFNSNIPCMSPLRTATLPPPPHASVPYCPSCRTWSKITHVKKWATISPTTDLWPLPVRAGQKHPLYLNTATVQPLSRN